MRKSVQILCVVGLLAAVGQLRMQFEQQVTTEMKDEHILTPSFDLESRASLSQKGFVASFGSLRPTLAAVTALSSAKHHARSDWAALEEAFESVVVLDPYNPYYWDLGAWHMAYNASSSSQDNSELPPLARQRLYREWIQKGSDFYDRGIAANPEDLSLRQAKARLWSSPYRITDFPLVAETLEDAFVELDLSPMQQRRVRTDLFYTLLRIPERMQEAYQLGRELFDESPQARYPSLINGLAALQLHPKVVVSDPLSLRQLYGSRARAAKHLSNYLKEKSQEKPRFGVELLLQRLEHLDFETFPK